MQPLWLFGYGSLIWRPDFEYISRKVAYVDGWMRRFWQGSHDHRGTPQAPGRVVTLIPQAGERCGGMAYQIEASKVDEIINSLDYREKNGYDRCPSALFFNDGSESVDGLFYVANKNNGAFLGEAPIAELVEQIRISHGPSGSNADYLLKLADALRLHEIEDSHVFELEHHLRG